MEIEEVTRKIGKNRGTARIWLEGKCLLNNGWNVGVRFDAIWTVDGLLYIQVNNGKRKVAGTKTRPIIDTNSNKLLKFVDIGEKVNVNITGNFTIAITHEK